jgi:DNA (cytosine-5)-methyltransferase 1
MFNYNWNLSDLKSVKPNSLNVFSCFACGGGSTMGYKMSGFNVLGCNEIDPEMIAVYKLNHKPKYAFLEPIQTFKNRDDLPEDLFNLDILDGSPPCSSFSMAGTREKDWGNDKVFREGQAKQVLDDLFFDFIDLAEKLKPKVIVAENVKGLITGNAKGYVKKISERLNEIGYEVQLFQLDAATMGISQRRKRVFFICRRMDLKLPKLKLIFNEKPVYFKDIKNSEGARPLSPRELSIWKRKLPQETDFNEVLKRTEGRDSNFSMRFFNDNDIPCTLTTKDCFVVGSEPRKISPKEVIAMSSFPQDFNFNGKHPRYFCGMSVPPLMMHKISYEIKRQLFL